MYSEFFNNKTASGIIKILTPLVALNLYCFSPSKSYPVGKTTTIEQKYNIDLVGNFSHDEIKDIKSVVKPISYRYANAFNQVNLVIEDVDSLYPVKGVDIVVGIAANNKKDPRFEESVDIIKLVDKEKREKDLLKTSKELSELGIKTSHYPIEYDKSVAHEIGHILADKYDTTNTSAEKTKIEAWKTLRKEFHVINLNTPPPDPALSRQRGFVSNYADDNRLTILVINKEMEKKQKADSMYAIKEISYKKKIKHIEKMEPKLQNFIREIKKGSLKNYKKYLENLIADSLVREVHFDAYLRLESVNIREQLHKILEEDNLLKESDKKELIDDMLNDAEELSWRLLEIKKDLIKDLESSKPEKIDISIYQNRLNAIMKKDPLLEDIAETAAYIFTGQNYADEDKLVREKIEAFNKFIEEAFGNEN